MDRIFPGISPEGRRQASLGVKVGGLGWRKAADTAVPAHLGALCASAPKVRGMATAMASAGLIRSGLLEGRLQNKLQAVSKIQMSRSFGSNSARWTWRSSAG